jgi:hypothetical protein
MTPDNGHGVSPAADRSSVNQIEEALAEVFTPEGAAIWMTAEHERWGGWTVSEMLNHGRGQEVLALIAALADGVFW